MKLGHVEEGKRSLELVKSRRSEGFLYRLVSPGSRVQTWRQVRSSGQRDEWGHLLVCLGLWPLHLWGFP